MFSQSVQTVIPQTPFFTIFLVMLIITVSFYVNNMDAQREESATRQMVTDIHTDIAED
jgi:hypothetical protein